MARATSHKKEEKTIGKQGTTNKEDDEHMTEYEEYIRITVIVMTVILAIIVLVFLVTIDTNEKIKEDKICTSINYKYLKQVNENTYKCCRQVKQKIECTQPIIIKEINPK